MKTDIERIEFLASSTQGPNIITKVTHTTRFGNKRIVGICAIVQSAGDLSLNTGTFRMLIDNCEVFGDNTDISLLNFTQDTPPNKRYYEYINHPINQSKVDIEFKLALEDCDLNIVFLLKCEKD